MRQSYCAQTYGERPIIKIKARTIDYTHLVWNLRTGEWNSAGSYPSYRIAVKSLPENCTLTL